MPRNPATQLNDAIPGDRAEQLASDLLHEKSRTAIKTVVEDYIGSTVFAGIVEDIQSKSLESTETYKKLSDKVQNQIENTLNERGLKNRNFWIPVWVNIAIALLTGVGIIVAMLNSK